MSLRLCDFLKSSPSSHDLSHSQLPALFLLTVAKFRLKLKKVGKTTRPFRYDLNQIPYEYTVEVRNRVPDELWNEFRYIVQETRIKTIPMEKKCKKAQWLSGEALQIAVKRREAKGKGEEERYTHLNAEFQRIERRVKRPSSGISAKK